MGFGSRDVHCDLRAGSVDNIVYMNSLRSLSSSNSLFNPSCVCLPDCSMVLSDWDLSFNSSDLVLRSEVMLAGTPIYVLF